LIVEKRIDDVFVWSSENGSLTIEIPYGWRARDKYFKFAPNCELAKWKRKHRAELNELRKMSGDKSTLKQWREEQQVELERMKKLKMDLLFVLLSVWPDH